MPEPKESPVQPLSRTRCIKSASSFASDSESSQESEPEIPISSEQWPPSSPPENIQVSLPPDSSSGSRNSESAIELRTSTKSAGSSPALPTNPSRRDRGTSTPSEMEIPIVAEERRSFAKVFMRHSLSD